MVRNRNKHHAPTDIGQLRGTGTIMSTRSIAETSWGYTRTRDCFDRMQDVEGILKRLADSFTEVNIAADFLQMRTDPDSEAPEQQLTCLIKDRVAAIQEQVTELYYALNHEPHPVLKQ
jgi:hypothetical protein